MISVIYEDDNFVAVSKPPGVLTHGIKDRELGTKETTVVGWLLEHYPEVKSIGDEPETRPGIVHRLDKETSGVLVIARNQKAFEYLKKLFQNHEVVKKYVALVHGKIEKAGVIDEPIGLKAGTTKRTTRINPIRGRARAKGASPTGTAGAATSNGVKMVKEAITEYKPLKILEKNGEFFTLLELTPRTGRTHQLRVHLASIHHPVVGDKLYGSKKNPSGLSRHFLHASSIEFTKPDGGRLRLEAELPAELQKIIDSLS